MTDQPRIVSPAYRSPTGEVYTRPGCWSHSALAYEIRKEVADSEVVGGSSWARVGDSSWARGFVDSLGRFHGRYSALQIARAAGQTSSLGSGLFSDDLWAEDGSPLWEQEGAA